MRYISQEKKLEYMVQLIFFGVFSISEIEKGASMRSRVREASYILLAQILRRIGGSYPVLFHVSKVDVNGGLEEEPSSPR
jgi:hypothetical protein